MQIDGVEHITPIPLKEAQYEHYMNLAGEGPRSASGHKQLLTFLSGQARKPLTLTLTLTLTPARTRTLTRTRTQTRNPNPNPNPNPILTPCSLSPWRRQVHAYRAARAEVAL